MVAYIYLEESSTYSVAARKTVDVCIIVLSFPKYLLRHAAIPNKITGEFTHSEG